MTLPIRLWLAVWLLVATSCLSGSVAAPSATGNGLALQYSQAFQQEMADSLAEDGYLDVIDIAVANPGSSQALPALVAALDPLVFAASERRAPIVERSREAMQHTVLRLRQGWELLGESDEPAVPAMRYFLAKALHELAMFSGELRGAQIWGARRGCAQSAAFVGPMSGAPLTVVGAPALVSGKFAARYPSSGSFRPWVEPTVVKADSCKLSKRAASIDHGLFEIAVDVVVPEAQRITVSLTTSAAASLYVGRTALLTRPFHWGGLDTTQVATVLVEDGTARIVVRLADRGDAGLLEVAVLDEQGLPLSTKEPTAGDSADSKASKGAELSFRGARDDKSLELEAAALLSLGQARTAEHALEARFVQPGERTAPMTLLFIRAMEAAGDTHETTRIEKIRALADALTKAAPQSWEARLIAAGLLERRKGAGEGTVAGLAVLSVSNPHSDLSKIEVPELMYVLERASGAGMEALARRVHAEIVQRVPGSVMATRSDTFVKRAVGKEVVARDCNGGGSRASNACAHAYVSVGDRNAALAEIDRLRALRQAPSLLCDLQMHIAIARGEKAKALALYDATPLGQRSLMTILPLLTGELRAEAKQRIARDKLTTLDGTSAMARLAPLFDEPNSQVLRLEKEGAALVEQDRRSPAMPGAATLVLRHVEHYGLDDNGFLSTVFYDLRRVAGTTDVDQAGFVAPPAIDGRGTDFVVRRRIHKRDGRILEPDAARGALQGGSELSQLEQGDYVEVVRIGFFSPDSQAELTIDTPDLMPERTSVLRAELSFRLPEQLKMAIWAHPLLGTPKEEKRNGYRFLSYTLRDKSARRLEEGVPYLEQGVRASLGTQTWAGIARSMADAVRALDDKDPFVLSYAREALGGSLDGVPRDRKLVEAIVAHTGKTIKLPSRGELSDRAGRLPAGSHRSALRTMVESNQGSRSWVIYRTLRELGFDVSVAVAEAQPFSNRADFPAHVGRFVYPLVVLQLGGEEIWIDADVEGAPLPPGKVSPELRGRSALLGDGKIVPVRSPDQSDADSVVTELTVDTAGTARGKVMLNLRGRLAGSLSETFNRVVGVDRRELLRNVVTGFVPWATVENVELLSKQGAWEVVIAADLTIAGFAQSEGRAGKVWTMPGIAPVPRGGNGTLAQAYASAVGRQSALSIDFALAYTQKRTIRLPQGAVATRVPAATTVKGRHISAERKTTSQAGVIFDEVSMTLPSATIDPTQFQQFVADLEATDQGFLASTRFELR